MIIIFLYDELALELSGSLRTIFWVEVVSSPVSLDVSFLKNPAARQKYLQRHYAPPKDGIR